MAREQDILLSNQAWAQNKYASTNLAKGGMMGWFPDLREIHGWQQYVPRNAIVLVLETPRFLNYLPNPEIWRESWRCLIEKHAQKVSGWKQGLKASITEQNVGGAGELLQIVGDMKRDRTDPVLDFVEKEGRPIQRLLGIHLRYALMDPETKTALISTLIDSLAARAGSMNDLGPDIGEDGLPKDWLLDWFGGSVLVYETDITNRFVDKASISTNFWPHETGPIDMSRDILASKEKLELSIPFSAVTVSGFAIEQVAQKIHDSIKKAHTSPSNNPAMIQDIEPLLRDLKSGYIKQVNDLNANAINKTGATV